MNCSSASRLQHLEQRKLIPQDRLTRRLQPVLKHRRVNAAEIEVVFQIALIQVRHALREGNFKGAVDFFRVHKAEQDWETHFQRAVAAVECHGGVAHLFFHTWEIDQQRDWDKLARVLEYVAGRKQLTRVTNGELFALCRSGVATAKEPSTDGGVAS